MVKQDKRRRLWEFDAAIFQPGPKTSVWRRFLIEPIRSAAKFLFYGLLLTYPLYLPVLGLAFGGLVFWGSFAGSMGVIGLLLWKFGYAKNYQAWNPSLLRQIVGLSLGFVITAGFFLGIVYLKVWMIPLAFAFLALGIVVALRKFS